jgi:hypothetical protein
MAQANSNLTYSDSEALEVECIDENEHLLREEIKENSPTIVSLENDITLQKILNTIDTASTGKYVNP